MMPYIALTRDSAENIMWPVLKEIARKESVDCTFTDSDLTCKVHGGASIKLFGADMKNFIERLRGIKTPFAAIDEAQGFRSHVETLIDDILTPGISDYGDDGQIAVCGTPGPVPKGYFHSVAHGGEGFRNFTWTAYQNPYHPDFKGFVERLMEKKGWDWNHPTILREYLGQWVADTDALVYKFNEDINVAHALPHSEQWTYVIGVDLGYHPDPTAVVVGAYNEYDRHLYLIEEFSQTKLIISAVAEIIRGLQVKYPNAHIVVDAADKQAVEEMKQRFSLPLESAEKHGKAGFIELMNSDLRTGTIKLLKGCCDGLIEDWSNLIWDTESDKRIEDSRYANHRPDAALYLWRYCFNYLWKDRKTSTNPHSEKAADDFWDREAERIERERHQKQQDEFDY